MVAISTTRFASDLSVSAQDYDVVLRGGLIVDGSGAPGFVADVAIADGLPGSLIPDLYPYKVNPSISTLAASSWLLGLSTFIPTRVLTWYPRTPH